METFYLLFKFQAIWWTSSLPNNLTLNTPWTVTLSMRGTTTTQIIHIYPMLPNILHKFIVANCHRSTVSIADSHSFHKYFHWFSQIFIIAIFIVILWRKKGQKRSHNENELALCQYCSTLCESAIKAGFKNNYLPAG